VVNVRDYRDIPHVFSSFLIRHQFLGVGRKKNSLPALLYML